MELSKTVIRFAVAVALTITAYILSNNLYFKENPLFGVPFFGQTLVSFAVGAFGVTVLPVILSTIGNWFEALVQKTVVRVASDFWEQQAKRAQESRRRKEEEQQKGLTEGRSVVVDTSAIIDGRILDIVKAGFLDNPLIVPRVVLDELQLISDSSDVLKRQRGRRGLDILKDLKKVTKVVILESGQVEVNDDKSLQVDKALVRIAKARNAKLATVDFNLNKVASVTGIKVINVNELSNAIKAVVLPGEALQIKIVQVGKEETQGVGYLPDGTMVVVEKGSDLVGKETTVDVVRIIQTPAGKMIFAKRL